MNNQNFIVNIYKIIYYYYKYYYYNKYYYINILLLYI